MKAVRKVSCFRHLRSKSVHNAIFKPVAAVIFADTGFGAYKSGVYSGCPESFKESVKKIDHAVIIIGYDKDGNYIIKNSWGTDWGDKGFAVVSKDRDCGLSYISVQYRSTAPPGTGVLFYNQISFLSNGSNITTSLLLFVVILVMIFAR